MKNTGKKNQRSAWAAVLLTIAVAVWFMTAVGNLRAESREKAQQQLEEAIRRAAVTCYANEGIYPPNVEYLQIHYGIQIDDERYVVYYDSFADNLMPEITVVELQ